MEMDLIKYLMMI